MYRGSRMSTSFNNAVDQIAYFRTRLTTLNESALISEQTRELLEDLLSESTLAKLIGKVPGGAELVKALHKRHKLASGRPKRKSGDLVKPARPGSQNIDPEYEPVSLASVKNIARTIKASKDNFAILVGTHGVAAVKPESTAWDTSQARSIEKGGRGPAFDNALPYVVIWTSGGGVDQEIAKYRMGRTDATGGTSGMEGGAPNLLNVLDDRIGRTKHLYRAVDAVERDLEKTRAGYKDYEKPSEEAIFAKLQPVMVKIITQAINNMGPKIQQSAAAGDDKTVALLTASGNELKKILPLLDKSDPDFNNPQIIKIRNAVNAAIDEVADNVEGKPRDEIMRNLARGSANDLSKLLNNIRSNLMKVA